MRHQMCLAATLFAQGIPFIHCGQEFARTKYGKPNTYNAKDDINWVDWNRKETYKTIVEYTKQCIQIRKKYACLRYDTTDKVKKHVTFSEINSTCLVYDIKDENEHVTIIFNPLDQLAETTTTKRELIFCNELVNNQVADGKLTIPPLSVIVLGKEI